MSRPDGVPPAVVTIGYAARADGAGVAYATLTRDGNRERTLLRVPFACRPLPALQGRDVAYVAVAGVAEELVKRGERVGTLVLADERLIMDLLERRVLPQALIVPYVALRCHLNRLHGTAVVASGAEATCHDLEARARAEVSLDAAA